MSVAGECKGALFVLVLCDSAYTRRDAFAVTFAVSTVAETTAARLDGIST